MSAIESDCSVDALAETGVSLVTVELSNPAPVARRVRVQNRLDGPVLPPRRAGVAEAGWSETGFEGVVPAEGRRVLGYACPSAPTTPPVSVTDEGRADDDADGSSPASVVRSLGDPRPPADAVPDAPPAPTRPDGPTDWTEADDDAERVGDAETERDADGVDATGVASETTDESGDGTEGVPTAVESWLVAVDRRIERGERFTDASVETAADALSECESVSALSRRLSADADALHRVAIRAEALSARAEAVDVPVEDLRRFA
ncbi:MAG: hypothetical protein ABEJ82_10030 [Haloplanus sp.]